MMNTSKPYLLKHVFYKSLKIFDEHPTDDTKTRRDLSLCPGVALGLVNFYIKNFIAFLFLTVIDIHFSAVISELSKKNKELPQEIGFLKEIVEKSKQGNG